MDNVIERTNDPIINCESKLFGRKNESPKEIIAPRVIEITNETDTDKNTGLINSSQNALIDTFVISSKINKYIVESINVIMAISPNTPSFLIFKTIKTNKDI